jgi:hypothetical protein
MKKLLLAILLATTVWAANTGIDNQALQLNEIGTPSVNPPSGTYKLYYKTGTGLTLLNSGGSESSVGGASFPLLAPAGTAAAPSYSFTGGAGFSDKGMYSSASNVLNFGVGGGNLLELNSSEKLNFYDTPADYLQMEFAGSNYIRFNGFGTKNIFWFQSRDNNSGPQLVLATNGSANLFEIDVRGSSYGSTQGQVDIYGTSTSKPITITSHQQLRNVDGTAALPAYSFNSTGGSNDGMYLISDDFLGFSAGGGIRTSISTGSLSLRQGLELSLWNAADSVRVFRLYAASGSNEGLMQMTSSTSRIENGDGTAAIPAYSFNSSGSQDNGMYLSGADQLGFSTSGGIRLSIENDSIWFRQGPEVAIWNEVDSNRVFRMFAASGANEGLMQITTTNGRIQNGDGTAAIPAYSFYSSGNSDNGMYLSASDQVSFSRSGSEVLRLTNHISTPGITDGGGRFYLGAETTTNAPYLGVASTSTRPILIIPDSSAYFTVRIGGSDKLQVYSGSSYFDQAITTVPATTALTADNQAVTTNARSFIKLTSDDSTPANRTFTLGTCLFDGQHLTLMWDDATDAGELLDTGTAKLSADWAPAGNRHWTLDLICDGTNWVEKSRSNN